MVYTYFYSAATVKHWHKIKRIIKQSDGVYLVTDSDGYYSVCIERNGSESTYLFELRREKTLYFGTIAYSKHLMRGTA